jgi:hypothetical protein
MTTRLERFDRAPDITITIPGGLRYWVAEALLEQIKWAETAERIKGRRRPIPAHRRQIADELRDVYNDVVP